MRQYRNRRVPAEVDDGYDDRGVIQSTAIINIILGVWLIISPYILSYAASAAKWNQTILGIVVVILAFWRLVAPRQQWASFLNGLAMIWAVIAPFVLSYSLGVAYWNEIIVAIVVGLLAFWNSGLTTHIDRRHPAV